ncbi:MAG TPA: hypothetical protein VKN76_11345 [Kiloniellaceae bacterium]|nr:hypothetical protein [Kiloniellaceae bacterium]
MTTATDCLDRPVASKAPLDAAATPGVPGRDAGKHRVLAGIFVLLLFAAFAALLIAAQADGGRSGPDILDGRGKWSGTMSAPLDR